MSSAAHGLGDQVLGRDCIGASPLEEAEEEVEVVEDPLPVVEAADRVENSASHDEVASRHAGVGCDDIIGAQAFRRTPGVGTGRVARTWPPSSRRVRPGFIDPSQRPLEEEGRPVVVIIEEGDEVGQVGVASTKIADAPAPVAELS